MWADRISGLLLLLLGLVVAVATQSFHIPYQYEPVGPKALPLLIASVLVVSGLALVLRPKIVRPKIVKPKTVRPQTGALLFSIKQALAIVALIAYALVYEMAGFVAATAVLVAALSILCGARLTWALLAALVFSAVGYLLLVQLLGLQLPIGRLWG